MVLICVNDGFGAGRRALELLHFEVAAFVWIGADRHAERMCRHAWPEVIVLSGDEKSLATAVPSVRSSHPHVQWVVIFAGRPMSEKGSLNLVGRTEGMRMTRQLLCVSVWLSSLTNGPQFTLHVCWKAPLVSHHACERLC